MEYLHHLTTVHGVLGERGTILGRDGAQGRLLKR
jgi:hypothetical protein